MENRQGTNKQFANMFNMITDINTYKTGEGDGGGSGLLYRVVREGLYNRAESCGNGHRVCLRKSILFL